MVLVRRFSCSQHRNNFAQNIADVLLVFEDGDARREFVGAIFREAPVLRYPLWCAAEPQDTKQRREEPAQNGCRSLPPRGEASAGFEPTRLSGHTPGGWASRQNWGKFKAHKWGGFTGRLESGLEGNSNAGRQSASFTLPGTAALPELPGRKSKSLT